MAMEIFVELPTGATCSLQLSVEASLDDLRTRLAEQEGLPTEGRTLVLLGEDASDGLLALQRLRPGRLREQGVQKGSQLRMAGGLDLRGGSQLFVKFHSGLVLTIDFEEETTTYDLKKKIQEKTGIRPDQMLLIYGHTKGKYMEDDKSLNLEYHVHNESVLHLIRVTREVIYEDEEGDRSPKRIAEEPEKKFPECRLFKVFGCV